MMVEFASSEMRWKLLPKGIPKKPDGSAQPAIPLARSQAQQAQLASICNLGLSPRLCAPYGSLLDKVVGGVLGAAENAASPVALATPKYTPGRLSTFTCDWWRGADNDHKLGMIQRIRNMATARINGGPGDGDVKVALDAIRRKLGELTPA